MTAYDSQDATEAPTLTADRPAAELAFVEPFSGNNVPSPEERDEARRRLSEAGIREFPYPFASLVSIASDIDSSTADRYRGYQSLLVKKHGLDFGDSAHLHRRSVLGGLGFLSPTFNEGRRDPAEDFWRIFSLDETVEEYHRGNIDHYHGFLARGPRVMPLHGFRVEDGVARISPPVGDKLGNYGIGESHVHAVMVVAPPEVIESCRLVTVRVASEALVFEPQPADDVQMRMAPEGMGQCLFLPRSHQRLALFEHVRDVEIEIEDGKGADSMWACLLSTTGTQILDRLSLLRRRYRVAASLVTEHSGYYFYNEPALQLRTKRLREAMSQKPLPTMAVYGLLEEDDLRISTIADDPESIACVMPELVDRIGVRFINSAGMTAGRGKSWELFDVINPAMTRAGNRLYVMRRTLPPIHESHPLASLPADDPNVARTRVESFGARLLWILEESAKTPHRVYPFYTHIGAVANDCDDPEPYLEPGPLRDLQDRVFNISGTVEPQHRIWFTRASTMCDYALMLQQLADTVQRDGDEIRIRSRPDPVLETTFPASPEQLYGVTFHVDDAARATVKLDGKPIRELVRNGPDESGRPSVTIAACGIRHVVFAEGDPADPRLIRGDGVCLTGAEWQWRDAHGTLRITDGDRGTVGEMVLPLRNFDPQGCQHFFAELRKTDSDVAVGFVVETTTGGRFFFGEPGMAEQAGSITARYDVRAIPVGSWFVLASAFYDMQWLERNLPSSALPSHPIRSIAVRVSGRTGTGVDLGSMWFGRARTHDAGGGTFVVTGRRNGFRPRERVWLEPIDSSSGGAAVETTVDQVGAFCLTNVAPGLYRIVTDADDFRVETAERRIEVTADTTGVIID